MTERTRAEGSVVIKSDVDELCYLHMESQPKGFKTVAIACYLTKEDAEHITNLWNASDGMTTERAVKLLECGEEMVEVIKALCEKCKQERSGCAQGSCPLKLRGCSCIVHDILKKTGG